MVKLIEKVWHGDVKTEDSHLSSLGTGVVVSVAVIPFGSKVGAENSFIPWQLA